jgi:hypothetical protein
MTITRFVAAFLLIAACLLPGPGLADAPLDLFQTAPAAQAHCPSDIVVWLNLPTGIYHFPGQRWYGRTNHGAYVCKIEADRAGDHPTHSGQ